MIALDVDFADKAFARTRGRCSSTLTQFLAEARDDFPLLILGPRRRDDASTKPL
jgi:hypothetical protein